MLKRTVSLLLVLLTISVGIFPVAAQADSWDAVKTISNQDVAVKKKNGEVVFGRLISADDKGIVIRLANKTALDDGNSNVAKTDIAKLWSATLKFRGRQTLRGAIYGAAVGAGAGAIIYSQVPRDESTDGLEVLVIPMAVGIGAGIGTVAGFFTKKSHKKGKLIYKA